MPKGAHCRHSTPFGSLNAENFTSKSILMGCFILQLTPHSCWVSLFMNKPDVSSIPVIPVANIIALYLFLKTECKYLECNHWLSWLLSWGIFSGWRRPERSFSYNHSHGGSFSATADEVMKLARTNFKSLNCKLTRRPKEQIFRRAHWSLMDRSIMTNYSSEHLNMELGEVRNNRKLNLTN